MAAPVEVEAPLTVAQVAEVLGEHPNTTYLRLKRGELRGKQYVPKGKWFITRSSLNEFLNPTPRAS